MGGVTFAGAIANVERDVDPHGPRFVERFDLLWGYMHVLSWMGL